MKTKEIFVARDVYGYEIYRWDTEPTDSELKGIFGLSEDADLSYRRGSFGWENEASAEEMEESARDWNSGPFTKSGP
jgi:hypothetical protein